MKSECRVAATPETAALLVDQGASVLVEDSAGQGSFFANHQYVDVGAEVVAGPEDLYGRADVVLKVKEPMFNDRVSQHEVDLMHEGQYLVCFLHPASPQNHDMIRRLAQSGVTSFTLDSMPRISRAQAMDALTSMSMVAGYKGLLMAANRLPKFMPMLGTAVGMIYPAQVLVIGAGVAGLQSMGTAKRLGAVVTACDIRPDACEQIKSLGVKLLELPIDPHLAVGEGGYAKNLPPDELEKERQALSESVAQSDIVVLTALVPGRRAPILVTKEMVESMSPGSIVVDISIDQGGNCELAKAGDVIDHNGVIVDGTQNIPGTVPTHATSLFAKNVLNFVDFLVHDGHVSLDRSDQIVAETLVTHGGDILHEGTLEAIGE